MAKKQSRRSKAQIEAERRYAETHEIVQVNVKFKTAADLKMWERLRERFDLSDSGIVRMAVKKLADTKN